LRYTASGKAANDQSEVGITFAKEPPVERSFALGVGNTKLVIPPKAADYRVDARIMLDSDVRVVDFTPHMHLRGKSFEFRAVFPDDWQITCDLAEERVLPKGTRIEATAYFDNSPNNHFNRDPNAEVRFGDQTWDEMMVGFIGVAIPPDVSPSKLVRKERKPEPSED